MAKRIPTTSAPAMLFALGILPLAVVGQVTSAATPTSALTPTLVWATMPTFTACSAARLNWRLSNQDPSDYNIVIRVVNGELDQTIPGLSSSASSRSAVAVTSVTSIRSSSSAVAVTTAAVTTAAAAAPAAVSSAVSSISYINPFLPGRALATPAAAAASAAAPGLAGRAAPSTSINRVIANASAAVGFSWIVNVPQGRYVFVATITDDRQTTATSNTFSVVEGTDTSCLAEYVSSSARLSASAAATSGSQAGASKPVNSSTASAATLSSNDTSSASAGGVSGGTIAGAVIGVLAGVGLLALLAFCLVRRRRRRQNQESSTHRDELSGNGGMVSEMRERRPSAAGNPFAGGTSTANTPSTSYDGPVTRSLAAHHGVAAAHEPGSGHHQQQQQQHQSARVGSIHSVVPDSVGRMSSSRRGSHDSYSTAPMSHSHADGASDLAYLAYPGTPGTFGSSRRDPFATPMETPLTADAGDTTPGLVPVGLALSPERGGEDSEVLSDKAARRVSTPLFGTTEPTARAVKRSSLQSSSDSRSHGQGYGELGLSGTRAPGTPSTLSEGELGYTSRRPSDFSVTAVQPVAAAGAATPGGGVAQRKGSMRRIPVPSLGPELRGQLGADAGRSGSNGGRSGSITPPSLRGSGKKQEYSLMPDLPIQHQQ